MAVTGARSALRLTTHTKTRSRAALAGDTGGFTALLKEFDKGIDKSFNLNDVGRGSSCLAAAIANGHQSIADMLIRRSDVDVNSGLKDGTPPLWIACAKSNMHAVISLISRLPSAPPPAPVARETEDISSRGAISRKEREQREFALDIDRPNPTTGSTPFSVSCQQSAFPLMSLLAKHGACMHSHNVVKADVTPLIFAAQLGDAKVCEFLCERGVPLNDTNANGLTALHVAVFKGHAPVVSVLLRHGADVCARDGNGVGVCELAWQMVRESEPPSDETDNGSSGGGGSIAVVACVNAHLCRRFDLTSAHVAVVRQQGLPRTSPSEQDGVEGPGSGTDAPALKTTYDAPVTVEMKAEEWWTNLQGAYGTLLGAVMAPSGALRVSRAHAQSLMQRIEASAKTSKSKHSSLVHSRTHTRESLTKCVLKWYRETFNHILAAGGGGAPSLEDCVSKCANDLVTLFGLRPREGERTKISTETLRVLLDFVPQSDDAAPASPSKSSSQQGALGDEEEGLPKEDDSLAAAAAAAPPSPSPPVLSYIHRIQRLFDCMQAAVGITEASKDKKKEKKDKKEKKEKKKGKDKDKGKDKEGDGSTTEAGGDDKKSVTAANDIVRILLTRKQLTGCVSAVARVTRACAECVIDMHSATAYSRARVSAGFRISWVHVVSQGVSGLR